MSISKWDAFRSYFYDIIKESTSSDYNELLEVAISKGRYQLYTENAIYSFDDLYDNYRRAFEKIEINKRPIKNVLILGLGLASIPSMLEKKFQLNLNYSAVEIDPEVARLAHKYVISKLQSPIEVFVVDALPFMTQNERKFDLICVDLFIDDIIPNKFQTNKFLQNVQNALTENGVVMYNRLARTANDQSDSLRFYQDNFKKVFEKGRYIDVKGNYMLISS